MTIGDGGTPVVGQNQGLADDGPPRTARTGSFPTMARAPITVASCDNDAMVRRAIAMYVNHAPSLELVASLGSGQEVLDFVARNPLDVLLLDVRMPEPDGFAVAESLERRGQPCRIIYLTSYLEERVTRDVMSGRVHGLLNKDVDPEVLTKAIHVVHDGLTVLHPDALGHPSARDERPVRQGVEPGGQPPRGGGAAAALPRPVELGDRPLAAPVRVLGQGRPGHPDGAPMSPTARPW